MARIVYPIRFLDWTGLFTKVFKADAADPLHTLAPFLTQEGYSMTTDDNNVTLALEADSLFDFYEKLMNKEYNNRDLIFAPLFEMHRAFVQFLKKLYRTNPYLLGDWTVTVDSKGRIVYPVDFMGKAKAMQTFIAYHFSFVSPAISPLQAYLTISQIDLAANLLAIDKAITAHQAAEAASSSKEKQREKREGFIDTIATHLRGEGGYLVGLYSTNPSTAGDWGFRVDTSSQDAKETILKLKLGGTSIIYNVASESIVQNTGTAPLTITKGTEGTGTPVTLNHGETWKVAMGYTIMTVNSSSLTIAGALTYMKHG